MRKGERGVRLIHVRAETKRLQRDEQGKPLQDPDGKPLYETRRLARPQSRSFFVFNAEQADGLPARPLPATWQRHEEAEPAIRQTEARIQHTSENRAYYELRNDRIVCCLSRTASRTPQPIIRRRCTSSGTGRGIRPG